MQASNFGGTFDQLFLWVFFMKLSQKMPLYFFYTMVQKSQNDQKLKSRGGGSCEEESLPSIVVVRHSYGKKTHQKRRTALKLGKKIIFWTIDASIKRKKEDWKVQIKNSSAKTFATFYLSFWPKMPTTAWFSIYCNFTNFRCSFIFGIFGGQWFHRN